MNKVEKIWMRCVVIGAVAVGSAVLTMAADKVVVVPLGTSNRVADLEARVSELETLLAGVSRTNAKLVFEGMNVQIVDGSGDTDGAVNGSGNLIIGYNELRSSGNDRSGSHNLVVGSQQNFSSYGGLVAGCINTVSGPWASVSGGYNNEASGTGSSISGGYSNDASGISSSVSGGYNNEAGELGSSVSGGSNNNTSGQWSSVSGGYDRSVSGIYDWRAGGYFQDQ